MPDKVYLQGSIAGVTLEGPSGVGLRASLVGRGNLVSAVAVNTRIAASGRVYQQSFAITEGIPFGVRFEQLPPDLFNSLVSAIKAAVNAGDTFAVTVSDDI